MSEVSVVPNLLGLLHALLFLDILFASIAGKLGLQNMFNKWDLKGLIFFNFFTEKQNKEQQQLNCGLTFENKTAVKLQFNIRKEKTRAVKLQFNIRKPDPIAVY